MIRISTRGRYALRAIVDLALCHDESPVLRQTIAENQGISADYVAQLFRSLGKAGLVEGVKGPGGGYRIARDPTTISAGDIVRAVEGPIALAHCVLPDDTSSCKRQSRCVTHRLWKRLSTTLATHLDKVSLQDLCDEANLEPRDEQE